MRLRICQLVEVTIPCNFLLLSVFELMTSCVFVLSCSVVSDSFRPHGLYVAHQAPLSMGFSREEYWSGLSCPSPGDLPNPGIEPASVVSLCWQVDSLPLRHLGSPPPRHPGKCSERQSALSKDQRWRQKAKRN